LDWHSAPQSDCEAACTFVPPELQVGGVPVYAKTLPAILKNIAAEKRITTSAISEGMCGTEYLHAEIGI
jgi:hypothetical protein